MPSSVTDRFRGWVRAESSAAPIVRFRIAFAAIWLVYDVLDLSTSGTARCNNWLATGSPTGLVLLQAGLIVCELVMLRGLPARLVGPATMLAAALRALEWHDYLRLNDFAYYGVTAVVLAHAHAEGGLFRMPQPSARAPLWPRRLLILQAGWMYLATGLLKLNPTWLSGKHLFVRLQYLRAALGWHSPSIMNRCADALGCDSVLAVVGVLGELTLGVLLIVLPRRRIVTPIALMIHGVGALATNVWFFGPSLIAQIVFLTAPDDRRALVPGKVPPPNMNAAETAVPQGAS
jgi:hypothetical protein